MLRRFFGIYFALLCIPFPLSLIPGLEGAADQAYEYAWFKIFNLLNDHFWHWQTRPDLNGSGDARDNYFMVVALIPVGLVLAFVWNHFEKWKPWTDHYIRWFLASMMLGYGVSKVRVMQFPAISAIRLHEPIGQQSPMGLLWNFMGFSRPYAIFAGLMEVVPGILLLFPRTATVGAAISAGVMANVFMMNMCFDVPVKIFSFTLMAFSIYILSLDRERIFAFVRGRSVPEFNFPKSKWLRQVGAGIACLVLGTRAYNVLVVPDFFKDRPFPGTWRIEAPSDSQWARLSFNFKFRMTMQFKDGHTIRYQVTVDEKDKDHFKIASDEDNIPGEIAVSQPDPDHLNVVGKISGQAVDLKLAREQEDDFPLLTRGFHWVNEYPFNN